MRAVVLAAGEGTRLRPLTRDRPKALLEVAGRPILERCFERLAAFSPELLIVVVGWRGERIVERFGDSWRGLPLAYATQEEPRGLAHALLAAAPRLEGDFLAMHGDVIYAPEADLRPVVRRYREEAVAGSILVERVGPDRVRRGACRVDPDGYLRETAEYPGPATRRWGRVAAGFYAFGPAVLEACATISPSREGEYELPDALSRLLSEGYRVAATDLDAGRVNVNTPADLEAAERILSR